MFGSLGIWEILLILLVVLLLFGARRIPEIGASLGKGIQSFRKSLKEGMEDSPEKNSNNHTKQS